MGLLFLLVLAAVPCWALWCPPLTGPPSTRLEVLIEQQQKDAKNLLHWWSDTELGYDRQTYIEDQFPFQEVIYHWGANKCGGTGYNVELSVTDEPVCTYGPIPAEYCQGELTSIPSSAVCISANTTVPGYPQGYTWRLQSESGYTDYVGYFVEMPDTQDKIMPVRETTYANGQLEAEDTFIYINFRSCFDNGIFKIPDNCTEQANLWSKLKV